MRGIGEEVKGPRRSKEQGRTLKEFRIGTGPVHVIWSRMKAMFLGFIIAYIFFFLLMIPMIAIDPLFGAILFLFLIVLTTVFMAFILLIIIAILYPVSKKVLKGNRIRLTERGVLVDHQIWFTTPKITNLIPYDAVNRIEKVDEEYFVQRKRSVSLIRRMLYMTTPPPPGGLYHTYSNKKAFLIIYLERPVTISNNVYNKLMLGIPNYKNMEVKEVIIDVHPDEHEEFMLKVEEMRYSSFEPKKVKLPPG